MRKNEVSPYFPSYNFFFKKKCQGIATPAKLEGGQIRFHSYEEDRLELIQQEFHEMEEAIARDLAKRTSGMRRAELHESVVKFLKEGTKPEKFYVTGTMAYDTKLDMPKELPFNPYVLARETRDMRPMHRVLGRIVFDRVGLTVI